MRVINITPKYQYVFDNGKIVKKELSKEKGVITSFIHPKDLIAITKRFELHLTEEEILLEMEKYIYSYPGVDINKEYKTIFIPIKRQNNLMMEAILIDTQQIRKSFEDILKIYKYIDFISPSFLAWSEYYNITKLEAKKDIFIYFNEDEAFLSAFDEGKYIFHKSLNKLTTLAKLLDKDTKEVIELLKIKGLDGSKYEDESEFNIIKKFFEEFFLKVFNIINISLSDYQIFKFDRIVFYSPFEINGLFTQYENYWNSHGIEFKKSILKTEYDHLEYLITVFNAKNYTNEDVNLTIFYKPPNFLTTKAGIFSIVFILSVLFIVSFVLYKNYFLHTKKEFINRLESKYAFLENRYKQEVKLMDKYKKDNIKIDKKIKNIKDYIEEIRNNVNILYQHAKEPMFYNIVAKVAKSMKKYSLKANRIYKDNKKVTLIIISTYDNTKEITSFMNDLINYGFKNVKSKFISNKSNFYISKVSFYYE